MSLHLGDTAPDFTADSTRGPIHFHTVRTVFIIGPDKTVRLILTYPMSTGRNFAEILRAIDSLQLTEAHPVATPADWQPGDDVIIGLSVDDEDAALRFPHHRVVKPYLRLTSSPDITPIPA